MPPATTMYPQRQILTPQTLQVSLPMGKGGGYACALTFTPDILVYELSPRSLWITVRVAESERSITQSAESDAGVFVKWSLRTDIGDDRREGSGGGNLSVKSPLPSEGFIWILTSWDLAHPLPWDGSFELVLRSEDDVEVGRLRWSWEYAPEELILRLPGTTEAMQETRFYLSLADGSYGVEKSAKEGVAGNGYVDLHFTGLSKDDRLSVQARDGASAYFLFQNMTLADIRAGKVSGV